MIFYFSFVTYLGAEEDVLEWEQLLKDMNRDYPGCVFIVRDEIPYLNQNGLNYTVPLLLNNCIKGREIGEKIIKQKYDIEPNNYKNRKKSFQIRIRPLNELEEENKIYYNDQ